MGMKDDVGEMMQEAFMEDIMPKIKKFIPVVKGQLEKSEEFLRQDELILIGKNSSNQFKIIKFSKKDYNALIELSKIKEKLKIYSFEQLLEMFMGGKQP